MDEVELYKKHHELHSKLDYVNTVNLSKIKEISKRVHFAKISTEYQIFNNKGSIYYKDKSDGLVGDYIPNYTIDYIITPRKLGVCYGTISLTTVTDTKSDEVKKEAHFNTSNFNNYARFIADLVADKVVYSVELESFVIVQENQYEVIEQTNFAIHYPVENKQRIDDFLDVLLELYREHLEVKHNFTILPYTFAGNDWIYNARDLTFSKKNLQPNELYAIKYDVNAKDIDLKTPEKFCELVTESHKSLNNLKLLHAYTMYRKLKLIQPEKWFLLKDFGRSGKGLLLTTFNSLMKVNKVNFDSLISGGFEASNEWMNFYGSDIAHANETGEITKQMMRILRKIATGETISGRGIGKNVLTFKSTAVLILDTNEAVDTGEITANTTRTVKIALKDRPIHETDEQRYQTFKPYWDFVQPNGKASVIASVSFLIMSLNHLKEVGRDFKFKDVTLKHYFSEEELTDTQILLLRCLSKNEFVLAGDEILKSHIEEDYKSLKYKKAKEDLKRIGVAINQQRWIDDTNSRVHCIGNQELFDMAKRLVND